MQLVILTMAERKRVKDADSTDVNLKKKSCNDIWKLLPGLKAMATHSSTLAWKIPWTEGPGRLQSMGSLGVRHDWANSLSLFTFMHWRRKWQPTPVFLPGESQGRKAWWAAVYGVSQSRIRLKRLNSSSSMLVCFWFLRLYGLCIRVTQEWLNSDIL